MYGNRFYGSLPKLAKVLFFIGYRGVFQYSLTHPAGYTIAAGIQLVWNPAGQPAGNF